MLPGKGSLPAGAALVLHSQREEGAPPPGANRRQSAGQVQQVGAPGGGGLPLLSQTPRTSGYQLSRGRNKGETCFSGRGPGWGGLSPKCHQAAQSRLRSVGGAPHGDPWAGLGWPPGMAREGQEELALPLSMTKPERVHMGATVTGDLKLLQVGVRGRGG